MAGEAILVNARRRRRKRAKARTHRRRKVAARRRRNPLIWNRRRRHTRRRVNARRARRSRRRHHVNPRFRLPVIGAIPINAIAGGTVGFVGTRYGATWALSMLPADWKTPDKLPWVRVGVKAVIGLAVMPMVAKMFGKRSGGLAGPIAAGAAVAIGVDLFETYLAHMLPLPAGVTSLADYEVMSDYEQINGIPAGGAVGEEGAYGGGAY